MGEGEKRREDKENKVSLDKDLAMATTIPLCSWCWDQFSPTIPPTLPPYRKVSKYIRGAKSFRIISKSEAAAAAKKKSELGRTQRGGGHREKKQLTLHLSAAEPRMTFDRYMALQRDGERASVVRLSICVGAFSRKHTPPLPPTSSFQITVNSLVTLENVASGQIHHAERERERVSV